MYIDVCQYLESMKVRLGESSRTYGAAAQAFQDHADLKACLTDGVVRLCSYEINPFVDEFDMDRGQNLYVYPFLKDKDQVIYSDPPFFHIGMRNTDGFGIYPVDGWEEEMDDCGIAPDVIEKVQDFLDANVPYGFNGGSDESVEGAEGSSCKND